MAGLGPQVRRRPAAHDLRAQLCVLQPPTAERKSERVFPLLCISFCLSPSTAFLHCGQDYLVPYFPSYLGAFLWFGRGYIHSYFFQAMLICAAMLMPRDQNHPWHRSPAWPWPRTPSTMNSRASSWHRSAPPYTLSCCWDQCQCRNSC